MHAPLNPVIPQVTFAASHGLRKEGRKEACLSNPITANKVLILLGAFQALHTEGFENLGAPGEGGFIL